MFHNCQQRVALCASSTVPWCGTLIAGEILYACWLGDSSKIFTRPGWCRPRLLEAGSASFGLLPQDNADTVGKIRTSFSTSDRYLSKRLTTSTKTCDHACAWPRLEAGQGKTNRARKRQRNNETRQEQPSLSSAGRGGAHVHHTNGVTAGVVNASVEGCCHATVLQVGLCAAGWAGGGGVNIWREDGRAAGSRER